jgi:hypothetical protein
MWLMSLRNGYLLARRVNVRNINTVNDMWDFKFSWQWMVMEAICTSETSVNFNVTTRCYIPEDSKLHTVNDNFNSLLRFLK